MARKPNPDSKKQPSGAFTYAQATNLWLNQTTDWPVYERRELEFERSPVQLNHVLKTLFTKESGETRTQLGDSLSENPFTYIARTLIVSIGAKAIFETLGVDPLTVKWREQILLEGTLIQMFEQACQFGIKLDEIKEGTSYRA